mmetsp:Transcript_17089/g.54883  ORF Transcript_17089/g.54883 Transcript_17089/m.54883 type:complete len:169 (+) Transcript_17089:2-508(+)
MDAFSRRAALLAHRAVRGARFQRIAALHSSAPCFMPPKGVDSDGAPRQEQSEADAPPKKQSRFKTMVKKYGKTYLVTYFTMYGVGFVGCYAATKYDPTIITFLSDKLATMDYAVAQWAAEKLQTGAGAIGVAYAMNEILEPVRIPLAMAMMPMLVKSPPATSSGEQAN